MMKDSEQAVKSKENIIKDLNRACSDAARDKEFLQQQLEELKVRKAIFVTKDMDSNSLNPLFFVELEK